MYLPTYTFVLIGGAVGIALYIILGKLVNLEGHTDVFKLFFIKINPTK